MDSFYVDTDVTEFSFEDTLSFGNNAQFEIRVVCSTTNLNHNSNKFNADVFARHGKQYKSWWFQNRNDFIRRQLDEDENITSFLSPHQSYTLMFCRLDNPDVDSLRDEYLQYLGGQALCKCVDHKLSLVRSFEKVCKCNICNERYEFYRCPSINCNNCICKNCYRSMERNNENNPVYIGDSEQINTNHEESNENINDQIQGLLYDSSDEEEDGLQEPHPHSLDDNGNIVVTEDENSADHDINDNDYENFLHSNVNRTNNGSLILTPDDFDDYVTSSQDPDLFINDITNTNNNPIANNNDVVPNL